jgi:hypothetical protein
MDIGVPVFSGVPLGAAQFRDHTWDDLIMRTVMAATAERFPLREGPLWDAARRRPPRVDVPGHPVAARSGG